MDKHKRLKKILTSSLIAATTSIILSTQVIGATRSTSYTYYNNAPKTGLLQSIDGPRIDVSDITALDYDNQGNLISITNALGHTSQIIAHDASGRPLESISPNALHTTFQYDVRGRLIQSQTFAEGDAVNARITTYTYTPAGDIATITVPQGDTLSYTYDEARRLTRVTDSLGHYIDYVPDLMGNILSETVHASDSRIIRQQSALYNQLGQLFQSIGADNQTTEYGYDLNGNHSNITDARANPTTQAFDALNRLKTVIDAKFGETEYGYDSAGNLNRVVDPNNQTTTYTYDGLGNLASLNSPDTGLTTYDNYDAAGNLLQTTDANGTIIHYSYDALNRLTQIQYPNSNQNISYQYDGSNYTTPDQPPAVHAPIGQRTGMSDTTGTMSWFYNAQGELIQSSQTLAGGRTFITSHSYQALTGLHLSSSYPSTQTITYQYDSQGKVSQIDSEINNTIHPLLSNIQYQPFGDVTTANYGNGLSLSRSFDLDGRLSAQSVTGNSTVQDLIWAYNPVSSVQNLDNLLNAALNQNFDYDELDRLDTAQTDLSLYGLSGFNYDANGNRILLDDNSQLTDYTINSNNNQTDSASGAQAQSFQYDARGNITEHIKNGDTYTYTYNQQNRLNQIDKNSSLVASYDYNGLGQRTSKTLADGTLTYYLYTADGQLMSEVDTAGNITKEYLYFDSQPLALIHHNQSNELLPDTGVADIIQNDDSATYTGSWVTWSGEPGIQFHYSLPGSGENQAAWTLPITTAGHYRVLLLTPVASILASNTPVSITHNGGTHMATINQKIVGDEWRDVGIYDFAAGNAVITLSNQADGVVTTYGIKLVYVQAMTLDDTMATFSSDWFTFSFDATQSLYQYGTGLHYAIEGDGSERATWTIPSIQTTGTYKISVFTPPTVLISNNAHYRVLHANGETNTTLNQQAGGWQSIGEYDLNAGGSYSVSLSNLTDSMVIADAVQLELVRVESSEQTSYYYYHNDHLGTPQLLTDQDQNVVWAGHYSPFGEVTIATETVENNLRFAGQYFDNESGLHYNYFRFYDPSLGRYITSDPIGLEGGLNTYAYVLGNPLSFTDPLGLIAGNPVQIWNNGSATIYNGLCSGSGCHQPANVPPISPPVQPNSSPNQMPMSYGDEGHRRENELLQNPVLPYGFFCGNGNCNENKRNLDFLRKRLQRQMKNKADGFARDGIRNQSSAHSHGTRIQALKAKIKEYEKAVEDCGDDDDGYVSCLY